MVFCFGKSVRIVSLVVLRIISFRPLHSVCAMCMSEINMLEPLAVWTYTDVNWKWLKQRAVLCENRECACDRVMVNRQHYWRKKLKWWIEPRIIPTHTHTQRKREREAAAEVHWRPWVYLKVDWPFSVGTRKKVMKIKLKRMRALPNNTLVYKCKRSMFGYMLPVVGDNHSKQSPTSTPTSSKMSVRITPSLLSAFAMMPLRSTLCYILIAHSFRFKTMHEVSWHTTKSLKLYNFWSWTEGYFFPSKGWIRNPFNTLYLFFILVYITFFLFCAETGNLCSVFH